ncbi:hypothetical protein MXB_4761, partial [Myxobolus squamalis]
DENVWCEEPYPNPSSLIHLQNQSESKTLSADTIPPRQIITLIQKYLTENGFLDIAQVLAERSGVPLDYDGVRGLVDMIGIGECQKAINSLPLLFPIETKENLRKIRTILVRYCLDQVFRTKPPVESLRFLRNNQQECYFSKKDIFDLTMFSFFLIPSPILFPDDIKSHTQSDTAILGIDIACNLSNTINELLPYTRCFQPNRLETLLKYSLMLQYDKCIFHSSADVRIFGKLSTVLMVQISLFALSIVCYFYTCFNGQTENYMEYKRYNLDSIPSLLKWSPDSTMMLVVTTCGRYIIFLCKIHCATPEDLSLQTTVINETISCADWFPDSLRYIIGTIDGNTYIANIDGHIINVLHGFRTSCILVVPTDESIIIADHLKRLVLWNSKSLDNTCLWQADDVIAGLTLCPDNQHIIFSIKGKSFNLFSLRYLSVVRTFVGFKNRTSPMKCTFMPGEHSKIFATGCENGDIFYWHLNKFEPVKVVEGNTKAPVGSVSWCPTDPKILASISGDNIINIWRSKCEN